MTRKDYQIIAKALKDARPERFGDGSEPHAWDRCVASLAVALADDNSAFRSDKFVEACGGYRSGHP